MKRIALLLCLLLACVTFSSANTITNRPLGSGSGVMSGILGSNPSYSFVFSSVSFATGSPVLFPNTPGLQNCIGCDPRGLITILEDSGISQSPTGQFYNGFIEFTAVSFVSSLGSNGALTVTYKAQTSLSFALCTDPRCDHYSSVLDWDSGGLWLVTAQFTPSLNNPSTYNFLSASFQPAVPEPSTTLLVGSGIMVLIVKVRKTAKANHHE